MCTSGTLSNSTSSPNNLPIHPVCLLRRRGKTSPAFLCASWSVRWPGEGIVGIGHACLHFVIPTREHSEAGGICCSWQADSSLEGGKMNSLRNSEARPVLQGPASSRAVKRLRLTGRSTGRHNRGRHCGQAQGDNGKLREGVQLQRCRRAPSGKIQRGSRRGSGKPRQ